MASRQIKLCDGCGRSMGQICEVWTLGRKEYCSRSCLDADRLKAESGKQPSRAYVAVAFIIALLMFAFVATPRNRAQDNGHLHRADYCSKWRQAGSGAFTSNCSYDSGGPSRQLARRTA